MINRLSAEYRERVEHEAVLRWARVVASLRDQATEGGRQYGETVISPEVQQTMNVVANTPPETMAEMPPEAGAI